MNYKESMMIYTSVDRLWRLPLTTKVTITAEGIGSYCFEDPLTQR